MHYKRISADCHLDMPWMPPGLFVENARRDLKERMPYVEDGPDGPQWVAKNGANFGLLYGVGPGGAKHVPGQNVRVDIMAEHGLYSDAKQGKTRCNDPHLRLKDMELDGVDAEVIYGILGAASKLNDTEASNEMLRIYNDWLKEFCSHYPDRQIGLACLPYGNIDEAVSEVHRVAKMGLRGLELSCSWDMVPMWHPDWEKLWQAVDEVDLPLHFHTFPTTAPRSRTEARHVQRAAMFTGVSAFQMGLIHIIAAMMGAGVFERYPNLRVCVRRERRRLARLCAAPDGFRVRGPLPRPDEAEAQRVLAPPVPLHLPVRSDQLEADRRDRRRDDDVGLGLSAHRRHLAGNRRNTSTSSSPACRPTWSTRSPARTPPSSTAW